MCRRSGVILGLFALFAPGLSASPAERPSTASSPPADIGPAPAVALTEASGKPFTLAGLRGKVVVVSFIDTTCNGSCPATTHNLYRVQQALKGARFWGS
jgi:protein SCO1/2